MSDTGWRPNCGPEVAIRRNIQLQRAHSFFAAREILQVETPLLSTHTVSDPNIESIATTGMSKPSLCLQTSPEHFMKRLLADGYPDIYQIGKVFRDGEAGRQHLAEFTMIEWYRLNFGLLEMATETIELVAALLGRDTLLESARFITFAEVFQSSLSLCPFSATIDRLAIAAGADPDLREALGHDRDAWLDLLLSCKISADFSADELTVITHYPASQAALARRCPQDDNVADRFEVFYGEIELANGYVELTLADELQSRFNNDLARRREKEQYLPEIDENLIAALQAGLPPCAGVAVGFDRLLMISEGTQDIHDVNLFTP